MAAAAKDTREPLPSELRKKYISAKATYEALWQSQLDEWEHEPPPVPKFQEMVGTEHFIPESRLARVKTGGAGSFATGAGGRAGQLERQCGRVWCRAAWHTSRWVGQPRCNGCANLLRYDKGVRGANAHT